MLIKKQILVKNYKALYRKYFLQFLFQKFGRESSNKSFIIKNKLKYLICSKANGLWQCIKFFNTNLHSYIDVNLFS